MLASLVGTITVIILIFARGFRVNALNAIIMGFFVVATLPIVLTMSAEIAGEKFAGIGSAFLQLLGNGAAVILVPTIEALHMRTTTYTTPLIVLAFLFGLVFFVVILMRETYHTA